MRIDFFGAAGTVTGSRYLLTSGDHCILVDCGLFQGLKNLRELNWRAFPVEPSRIDAVVLTHAHIDHSGYLPALVRDGFRGLILCTRSTADLCNILLPDSAHLQEEEAKLSNRRRSSKHHPALPLYTVADAAAALERLAPVDFGRDMVAWPFTVRFDHASHILGASSVYISDGEVSIAFSGDLGRCDDPLLRAPDGFRGADYLVVESTYGDRIHPPSRADAALATAIRRTIEHHGTVVIPAFAVGRAQLLLHELNGMQARGEIPQVPIYLDSPMASKVTNVMRNHPEELRITVDEVEALMRKVQFTTSVEQSKALDTSTEPKIIISASGMATGGRVLFHLERFAPDPHNLIVIAGFQAAGTRGAAMSNQAEDVKIFGRYVPIRAEVVQAQSMSSHADAPAVIEWMRAAPAAPRQVFVTHGEPAQSDAFRHRIMRELGWAAIVPRQNESFELQSAALIQPSGSVKQNVVPAPTSLSTRMVPR